MNKRDKKIADAIDVLEKANKREEKYVKLIGLPTIVGAIEFRMEQMNYTQTDLAKLLGSRPRASEYLSGKRKPSKRDALKLHREWGIPLECLIQ